MSGKISANPNLLRWGRESLNLSVEEVARRMKKQVSDIEAWECGEAFPTYIQLEKLAYEIYKRPVALFFFPDIPEEETIEESFRTLPTNELLKISPQIRWLVRKARVLQMNMAELSDAVEPLSRSILHDLRFEPSNSVAEMAAQVRTYLGIDLAEQKGWMSFDTSLNRWRTALEDCGVFVFKNSFRNDGSDSAQYSGFCLYHAEFPIIYVNNNNSKARQIFTLFHELAHLLLHTSGIDLQQDNYINQMVGDNRDIEVLCNRFTAEFLVPSKDFQVLIEGIHIDERVVTNWANSYCVSCETILRKLRDWNRISQSDYETKTQQWSSNRRNQPDSGGNYYLTKWVYLGRRYIESVFRQYHQGRISVEQAAAYLDMKVNKVDKLEDRLFSEALINS